MLIHGGELAQAMIQHGMLIEHDQARFIVSNWRESLDTLKNESAPYDSKALMQLMRHALDYADLLKRHAEKENSVAYPFGVRVLPESLYASLDERTRAFEEEHKNRREECLSILDSLRVYLQ